MLLLSQSVKFIRQAAALLLLSLLATSCQWVMGDYEDEETADSNATQYINITISVSNAPVTRANPTGGPDGDGREMGIDTRENEVTGVTVILFRNNDGINAPAQSATATKIDHVAYYLVTRDDSQSEHANEVFYTTGEQKLSANLSPTDTYHMLIVANANLRSMITPGTTTLQEVRDMTLTSIYIGTGKAQDAQLFVMTSTEDCIIDYSKSTLDNSTNRRTFTPNCIHIERLAARLDFWAKNSNYNASYTTPGYEYAVKKPNGDATGDRFVLTSITPFNLNNGTGSAEYLFKRTNDAVNHYMHSETETTTTAPGNWVIDPMTLEKYGNATPSYFASPLSSVVSDINNGFSITMEGQQDYKLNVNNTDNIIVGYAKENTLSPAGTSRLYYYATGLAFKGYYYSGGSGTGVPYVFYHFIRHQGEQNEAYQAYTSENIDDAKNKFCPALMTSDPTPATPAMNFGIVRNNIYRVSIDNVTAIGGFLQLTIAVHDWRNVQHPDIYI